MVTMPTDWVDGRMLTAGSINQMIAGSFNQLNTDVGNIYSGAVWQLIEQRSFSSGQSIVLSGGSITGQAEYLLHYRLAVFNGGSGPFMRFNGDTASNYFYEDLENLHFSGNQTAMGVGIITSTGNLGMFGNVHMIAANSVFNNYESVLSINNSQGGNGSNPGALNHFDRSGWGPAGGLSVSGMTFMIGPGNMTGSLFLFKKRDV